MLRAIARTALILLALAAVVYPHLPGFCPVTDASDTGGGALGCALGQLLLYLVGQVLFAVGSLVRGESDLPVPLVPSLDAGQRRLVGLGLGVSVGGTALEVLVSPPVSGAAYVFGWTLLVGAWVSWGWSAAQSGEEQREEQGERGAGGRQEQQEENEEER